MGMKHRTLANTTALLTMALVLSACSNDEDDNGVPIDPTEINPGLDQSAEPGEDGTDEGSTDEGETQPETSSDEAAESSNDAYEQALEDSETLDEEEDYSEYQMGDREFEDADEMQQFFQDQNVVMERAAEVATGFQAGDWNKDVAIIRASYLMIEGVQQPGIPERPQSGDPAWDAAMECGADAEVRTQVEDPEEVEDVEQDSHSPHTHIIAEYRWSGGDEGCDLSQPDHYYHYTMSIGDDALITSFDRDEVPYEENEPGLFDD